jgi:hypothetical protein
MFLNPLRDLREHELQGGDRGMSVTSQKLTAEHAEYTEHAEIVVRYVVFEYRALVLVTST